MRLRRATGVLLLLATVLWIGGLVERVVDYVYDFVRDDVRAVTEAETNTLTVRIENVPREITESASFGYLLVRFGNNEQVEQNTAVDDTRRNIQNTEHAAQWNHDDENLTVKFPVRLHGRLGTEFKPFVDLSEAANAERLREVFEDAETVENPSISAVNDERVYFLVASIPRTESPEGFENNFLPPK